MQLDYHTYHFTDKVAPIFDTTPIATTTHRIWALIKDDPLIT